MLFLWDYDVISAAVGFKLLFLLSFLQLYISKHVFIGNKWSNAGPIRNSLDTIIRILARLHSIKICLLKMLYINYIYIYKYICCCLQPHTYPL